MPNPIDRILLMEMQILSAATTRQWNALKVKKQGSTDYINLGIGSAHGIVFYPSATDGFTVGANVAAAIDLANLTLLDTTTGNIVSGLYTAYGTTAEGLIDATTTKAILLKYYLATKMGSSYISADPIVWNFVLTHLTFDPNGVIIDGESTVEVTNPATTMEIVFNFPAANNTDLTEPLRIDQDVPGMTAYRQKIQNTSSWLLTLDTPSGGYPIVPSEAAILTLTDSPSVWGLSFAKIRLKWRHDFSESGEYGLTISFKPDLDIYGMPEISIPDELVITCTLQVYIATTGKMLIRQTGSSIPMRIVINNAEPAE